MQVGNQWTKPKDTLSMTEKTNQNFCECCGQKIPKEPLSPALVREFLNYDAEKGTLTWKKRDRKHFNYRICETFFVLLGYEHIF
jgi:hypothetical protein